MRHLTRARSAFMGENASTYDSTHIKRRRPVARIMMLANKFRIRDVYRYYGAHLLREHTISGRPTREQHVHVVPPQRDPT